MAAVFLCIVIYLLTCCSAYVNLALRKPAFEDNIYIHANVTAGNAVDGRKSNLRGTGGECSMSTEKKRTATWWVNLTSTRSIHDIRIYYMTDNVPWDASNKYTARFLGFSIYISNTTKLSDGKLCYKDTYFTRRTIPAVFNTTCFVHGQYVIYYNERLPGVTYPSDYSEYAFSDLCEVEVYGCPTLGYYGINCTTPCPDVNCGYCHIQTGTCQGGCKPGYKGHQCELECDNRKYGDACQKSCGQCVNKTQCDNVIGTCLQGCEAGYKGQMCDQECTDGFFGRNCQEKCNETCLSCNMFNGVCDKGCRPGWEGNYCQSACQDGKYGFECKEKCSPFCFRSGICLPKTGACLDGCKKGWTGDECFEVSVQDDGNTSTNLSVIGIAALSVAILSIMINAVQLLYKLLLRQKNKRNRNKTYEQSKSEHVFTPDISGYDSLVISRPEDNYQELNTVTADR
ncbi:multiple epidermal growth factor-like domains protein 11 isoform X2 [Crassostrea angulata]|uniref:multiple epidermal growth factor-like domains protein 11 isoform X2 n=1 Tax=Magallana angulata TaxID=2784310 RepID=UPI0022B21503|nr:multiple epidermal growth factor-like domains protein 11 isoform X2 [Crassostrea angulata]